MSRHFDHFFLNLLIVRLNVGLYSYSRKLGFFIRAADELFLASFFTNVRRSIRYDVS